MSQLSRRLSKLEGPGNANANVVPWPGLDLSLDDFKRLPLDEKIRLLTERSSYRVSPPVESINKFKGLPLDELKRRMDESKAVQPNTTESES